MLSTVEFQQSVDDLLQTSAQLFEQKIRDDFFTPTGSLREGRDGFLLRMRASVRAELALACILGNIIREFASELDPETLLDLGSQLEEELRHYKLLRAAIEAELGESIQSYITETFDSFLNGPVWQHINSSIANKDYIDALLELEMVHESSAAAAMEVLVDAPVKRISDALRAIHGDEVRHQGMWKRFLTANDSDPVRSKVVQYADRVRTMKPDDWKDCWYRG